MHNKSQTIHKIVLAMMLATYGTHIFTADSAAPSNPVSPPLHGVSPPLAPKAEDNATITIPVIPAKSAPPAEQMENSPPMFSNTNNGETLEPPPSATQPPATTDSLGTPVDANAKNVPTRPIWQAAHEQKVWEHQEQMRTNQRGQFEAQIAELNARYQHLLEQAASQGVALPAKPVWNQEPSAPPPLPSPPGLQIPNSTVVTPEYAAKPNVNNNALDRSSLEWMQAVIDRMTPEERDVCTTVHRLSVGLMQQPRNANPPPAPPYPDYNTSYGNPYGYGGTPAYGVVPNYSNGSAYEHQNYNQGYNYGYGPNYNYDQRSKQPNPSWQGRGWSNNQ